MAQSIPRIEYTALVSFFKLHLRDIPEAGGLVKKLTSTTQLDIKDEEKVKVRTKVYESALEAREKYHTEITQNDS